jgi:hypothetical protein
MENKKKFHFSIFDIIIILVVLAVAAVVVYIFRPSGSTSLNIGGSSGTVVYTVELTNMPEGTADMVSVGDTINDSTKNYGMGTVLSVDSGPYTTYVPDVSSGVSRCVTVPGYETVYITIQSPATITDSTITTSGGYVVRVGNSSTAEGPGYAGTGYVVDIER